MLNKIDIHPIYIEPFHVDFTGRVFMGVLGNHLLNAAGNHSQKRGFTTAGRTQQGEEFTFFDFQIQIGDDYVVTVLFQCVTDGNVITHDDSPLYFNDVFWMYYKGTCCIYNRLL